MHSTYIYCVCVCVCRGVWDSSRPAGAGRGRDAGVPLPAPFLPVRSGPEGGHAGGRRPDAGETRRQTHPPRLPTDDHQARQRNDRHVHLADYTHFRALLQTRPEFSQSRINTLFISGLSQYHPTTPGLFRLSPTIHNCVFQTSEEMQRQ